MNRPISADTVDQFILGTREIERQKRNQLERGKRESNRDRLKRRVRSKAISIMMGRCQSRTFTMRCVAPQVHTLMESNQRLSKRMSLKDKENRQFLR